MNGSVSSCSCTLIELTHVTHIYTRDYVLRIPHLCMYTQPAFLSFSPIFLLSEASMEPLKLPLTRFTSTLTHRQRAAMGKWNSPISPSKFCLLLRRSCSSSFAFSRTMLLSVAFGARKKYELFRIGLNFSLIFHSFGLDTAELSTFSTHFTAFIRVHSLFSPFERQLDPSPFFSQPLKIAFSLHTMTPFFKRSENFHFRPFVTLCWHQSRLFRQKSVCLMIFHTFHSSKDTITLPIYPNNSLTTTSRPYWLLHNFFFHLVLPEFSFRLKNHR